MRSTLFTLVSKKNGRRCDVEILRDFGVVCPDLVSTNGSPSMLADFVWSCLQFGRVKVEPIDSVGAPDLRSEVSLREWLDAKLKAERQ